MLAFLSVAFLIYGSLHLYALSKVWNAFPHSPALGFALAAWGLVMTFSPLIIWFLGKQHWHAAFHVWSWVSYVWMGYLFLFCWIALALDLGHGVAMLLQLKWPLKGLTALLGIGLPAFALAAYAFAEARQLRMEELKFTTPKLASGRVTIAQISDLHLGAMLGGEFLDRIIARLREAQPDIIVATGDILDGQGDDLDELARHFLALKPPKGAYAILGNHEFYAGVDISLRFLRDAGFTVLRGESMPVGGIILAGVDDPAGRAPVKEMSMDTRNALVAARKTTYVVLLKHQPIVDAGIPFDLQLSGHVHGGQLAPFGIFTVLAYGLREGLFQLSGGRMLYVNRGAGTWGPPMRLAAPPEITLITIESENK